MQVQPYKRIVTEDYDSKDQELISKLAYSLNQPLQDITTALTNNLNIDDNFQLIKKDLTVQVDATGTPTTTLQFKTGLSVSCAGIQVIKATNQTNSTTYVTGQPFITFTENSGLLTVNNIAGLPANNVFQLRLVLYP